jgi:RNA polymerase-binding transcription factor DksA
MDEKLLEMAELLSASLVDEGIRKAKAGLPVQPESFDGLCLECGEPIGAPRLRFGAVTCIECQEHLELEARLSRQGQPES